MKNMLFALLIAAALPVFGNDSDKIVKKLKSEKGSARGIGLAWNGIDGADEYAVYRSVFADGPYEEIGRTAGESFNDKNAAPGVKYWYRVSAIVDDTAGPPSEPDFGYMKIPEIKGESMSRLIAQKKRRLPLIKSRKEKKIINFLKKYYTNEIKLSIIIFVGERYVRKGELILLTRFDDHKLDHKKRTLFLIRKGKYIVKFYSNRLFTILKEAGKLDPAGDKIGKRLLNNAVTYCIYTGIKEFTGSDGITYFLHSYEAVGLSTEYYKNCREWRSNTIMLGSSNKKIKEMMREAQRKSIKNDEED